MEKTLPKWVSWVVFYLLSLPVMAQQIKVVGYMPSWAGSASSIQYSKLTHINYSFAIPNWDGTLKPLDNASKLQQIISAAHAQGKKVFIACGGWSDAGEVLDARFESIAANATYRGNLINSLVNLANQYGADGIDIDWEYPNAGASSTNFYYLMQGLYDRLNPLGKGLSAAVGVDSYGAGGIPSSIFPLVDHLNIMAYDASGTNHSTYNLAVATLDYWTSRGLPASKQILGVPFYARPSWNAFSTLLAQGADPYADQFGGDGYNGITTIQRKTQLAIGRAGGIMIWEISQDATGANSLLSAIDVIVKQSSGSNQAPTVSLTSPANGATYTSPANVTISANASDPDGSVAKVEFFNGTVLLGTDNTAPYNYTWTGVAAGSYSITAKATDNKGAAKVSTAISITVNAPLVQSPYVGVIALPGKVEAENYDKGGQGTSFNDVTAANEGGQYRTDAVDVEVCALGGYSVGWIAAGEWLEYTVNVSSAGNYQVSASVAAIASGKFFHLEMNGVRVGSDFNVPNTGGWQTWREVSVTGVSLAAGQQVLRLFADTDGFNIHQLTFQLSGTTPNKAPTVALTSPAAGGSFNAPASIAMSATASDADGSVSRVEFYSGSTLLFTDNSAPYSYTWSAVAAGTYSITAVAFDNLGLTGKSSAVTVTVNAVTTSCSTPAWKENEIYVGGNRVSRNGKIYEAKWWTRGEDPLLLSGQWDVWKVIGPCGARFMSNSPTEGEGVSPNPVVEQAVVTLYSSITETGTLQIIDMAGEVIADYTISLNEGWNDIKVQAEGLQAGVYIVKAGEKAFRMVVR